MHEDKPTFSPFTPSPSPKGRGEPDAKYETQDVLTAQVAKGFFVIVAVGVVMSILAMGVLLTWFIKSSDPERPTDPAVAAQGMELPSGPRLQPAPGTDAETFFARQKARVGSYGWVDEQHAHVPIERAMEIILEEGLPARPPVDASSLTPSPSPRGRGEASGGAQ